ncbi:MAG: thiolase family protein [Pseudomonas sp.]|uniref:thiolase family protein n=1 Tax=Pseudomonas sp. TaxID=306 RepID=UPI003981B709
MELLGERRAAISGVGIAGPSRQAGRSALELTLDAAFEALADAGLTSKDIDGLSSWPGMSSTPGMAPVSLREVKEALGLELNWFCASPEAPGQLSAVMNAAMAVATGQARHVLCFRTLTQYSEQVKARGKTSAPGPKSASRVDGLMSWVRPFNGLSAAHPIALVAARHMHEFGLTREQLGAVAVNGRRNAMLNPRALYRDPLSLDDYLQARMVTEPLCLYDCDAPIDGASVIIVSNYEAARDLRKPPLRIEAMSGALYGRNSWDQFDDITTMAARDAGRRLWQRTDLRPQDVDVANLYDGFSILTLVWLEALGFCGRGEAGAFVEGGQRIGLEGELPLNTGGGQLSAGRLHGFGLLIESCQQLWGEGGDRQVAGDPEVAVTAAGGGPLAGCVLLTRE